jgi:hypothetical protein
MFAYCKVFPSSLLAILDCTLTIYYLYFWPVFPTFNLPIYYNFATSIRLRFAISPSHNIISSVQSFQWLNSENQDPTTTKTFIFFSPCIFLYKRGKIKEQNQNMEKVSMFNFTFSIRLWMEVNNCLMTSDCSSNQKNWHQEFSFEVKSYLKIYYNEHYLLVITK